MDPHIISSIVTLLLIACIVSIITEWLKQPYTIALVFVGLLVAVLKITPQIHLDNHVTFTLILPPLLFYGSLHTDLEQLKNNWKSIVLLAIPGVVLTTLLIGFLIHSVLGVPMMIAMLFGALISPTDPISVLSILNKVGAPKRLKVILEGESLFNDGTGVVIFSIILAMVTGGEHFDLGHSAIKFIKIAGGGALIGFLCGYIAYKLLKKLDNNLLEVTITIVLVFGTPLLAEFFHLSGIIAIVVAGLIIGNYGKIYTMADNATSAIDTFWEVIDFMINSILFVLIGVELQVINQSTFVSLLPITAIIILVALFSRAIVVYPLVWIRNAISRQDIPQKWSHLIFWGGLKGSISIALVVGLPQSITYRNYFLVFAFAFVMFSLFIQALTMKPLIQKLDIKE